MGNLLNSMLEIERKTIKKCGESEMYMIATHFPDRSTQFLLLDLDNPISQQTDEGLLNEAVKSICEEQGISRKEVLEQLNQGKKIRLIPLR